MMENKSVTSFLWALTLDSVSYFGPYNSDLLGRTSKELLNCTSIDELSDNILHGVSNQKKHLKRVQYFMNTIMHVYDSNTYFHTFFYLMDHDSETVLYANHMMLQILTLDSTQFVELHKTSDKNADSFKDMYKNLKIYKDEWTMDAVYAYQLSNAIALTRIALFKGYITREVFINNINSISEKIKENFKSYKEFGDKAVRAYHFDALLRSKIQKKSNNIFDKNRYSHAVYGIWQYYNWPEVENEM